MKSESDTPLEYEVVRSKRSTADIVIERDGSLVVRAPEWADDEQVANIVESKHYWIFKGLAEWRDLNATRVVREYSNGEGFLYLGRGYRLSLVADQDQPLVLKNGRFKLRRDLVDGGDIEIARGAFRDFYVTKGRGRIRERVDYFSPKLGVEPSEVVVRELAHKWATCSPSAGLAFHWKCMMAPQSVIDYIVVHELAHLHYRDHSHAFWNVIDKVMPDYRDRKAWLRRNGAGLSL